MKSLNHAPLTLLSLLLASPLHAIEIEQRPLTTETTRPAATSVPAAAVVQPAAQPVAASAPVHATTTAAAKPAAVAAAPSNPAWDLFQQLESLRGTVAQLQGQVEEQQQLIDRLREDLKVRYTDLDQRLDALNQRPAVAAPVEPTPPMVSKPDTAVTTQPASVIPAGSASVPAVVPANPAATPVEPAASPKPKAKELTAEEIERQKQAYLAAYQRFRGEGPAAAIKAMQDFLKQNPDSVFAPNAYYWTGEFQLALETPDYGSAETNFKKVISDYDGTPKVAASYYKLGTIADLRGNRPEARRRMTDLVARFPGSPEARLAQSWLDQNAGKQ